MEQIIINLLSNSVKYTSEGFVTLVVNEVKRDTRENTSTVEFLVRDTGALLDLHRLEVSGTLFFWCFCT